MSVLALLLALVAVQDDETVAFTHLRILTVSKGEIENGTILFKSGKIAALGVDVQPPAGSRIIDGKGLVAMPGLVQPHSRLGIYEVANTPGSTPQHLAFDEINPSLEIFHQALRTGYTTFAVAPTGGGIAGQGAFVKPMGWTRSELVIEKLGVLRIILQPGTAGKEAIRQALTSAKNAIEAEKKAPPAKPDDKTPPLVRVLKGELPAIVETSGPSELLHFWQILEGYSEFKPKLAYAGTSDVYKAAAELGSRKARVILRPMLSLVPFTRDRVNAAAELTRAGAEVAFAPLNDSPESLQGTFFRVSELVKFGLSRDAALKALTIVPAEALGLEKRVGSLEAGKDADVLLFTGDPLSAQSRLRDVYINGNPVFHGD